MLRLGSGLAHDFNNVLAAVRTFVELARRNFKDEDRGHLDRALEAIDFAAGRNRQLLALAETDAPLDTRAVLEAIGIILNAVLGKRAEVEVKLDDTLWPVTGDGTSSRLLSFALQAAREVTDGETILLAAANAKGKPAPDSEPDDYVEVTVTYSTQEARRLYLARAERVRHQTAQASNFLHLGDGETILIVGSDDLLSQQVARLLEGLAYSVAPARDMDEATVVIAGGSISCALVLERGSAGHRIAETLRGLLAELPVGVLADPNTLAPSAPGIFSLQASLNRELLGKEIGEALHAQRTRVTSPVKT